MRGDVVMVSLGGVQRFIAESRTTGDVAGASAIFQRLARHAASVVERECPSGAEIGLVFPVLAPGDESAAVSNKIVFVAPEGRGRSVAAAVASEVDSQWAEMVRDAFRASPPATPGVPDVAWVCVSGEVGESGYGETWKRAQRALVARRRARVFTPVFETRTQICSAAPHLPAMGQVPRWARPHETKQTLSAAVWVKRRVGHRLADGGFPSTAAMAARHHLDQLRAAAGRCGNCWPSGRPWGCAPSPFYAVVVQDIGRMSRSLTG